MCCRVIYIIDEDDRWGYAYGTLPHHVERGEESFIVSKDKGGNVTFTVESSPKGPRASQVRVTQ